MLGCFELSNRAITEKYKLLRIIVDKSTSVTLIIEVGPWFFDVTFWLIKVNICVNLVELG